MSILYTSRNYNFYILKFGYGDIISYKRKKMP